MVLCGAVGCTSPVPPATFAVTAMLSNTPDTPRTETLHINYTQRVGSGTRLVSSENMGFTYLLDASLALQRQGMPNTDAYYLQVISKPSAFVGDDSDSAVVLTGDWMWMDAHASDLFVLALQPTLISDPTSIAAPHLDPRRTSVSAWLAVVEEDDAVLPYFVAPGTPNCRRMSPTDCFDVQSIAMSLLNGVERGLRAAADPPPGGGPDPDLRVRATGGAFTVSFIPNVIHSGLNRGSRRSRGFGLVFRLEFQVRAVGRIVSGRDVGTPYHDVTALVPMAIHFEDDGTGQLAVTIDPLDLAASAAGAEMPARITVEVHKSGTPVDEAVATAIADTARASLVESMSAEGLSTLASGFFSAYFNLVRPARPLPSNFDVVLIGGGGIQGVPAPMRLSPTSGVVGPRLVFLE